MVEVLFVDGTEDVFETKNSEYYYPWKYLEKEQCFLLHSIRGDIIIPVSFIKCLRHYEVDE